MKGESCDNDRGVVEVEAVIVSYNEDYNDGYRDEGDSYY